MNCPEVTERMPWLLNQSLPQAEREAAIRHLRDCESCRRELNDTAEFLGSVSPHPAGDIVEYVFGVEMSGPERSKIGDHLEQCVTCRREADLARRSRAAMPLRRSVAWGVLPIAAAVLMTIASAALAVLWKSGRDQAALLQAKTQTLEARIEEMKKPTARARVVDLLPETALERSGAARTAAQFSAGGPETTLLLNSRLALDRTGCAIRLNGGAATLWSADRVERGANGEFLVRIPSGYLAPGSYSIAISCGGAEERYRFAVN